METGYDNVAIPDEYAARPAPRPPESHRRKFGGETRPLLREHRGFLLVCAIGVVVPTLLAAVTGNLSIAHNDAWAYSRIAQTFGDTGRIELLGWNRSALVGQFLPLGPLASSIVVQQLFVALLGLAALFFAYDLVRPTLGSRRAAFATLLLALWPGFGLLTTSFMPDIPALALALGCVALGRRALDRDSLLLFSLATAVGFWGVTIRAQALAAPLALLLHALLTRRGRSKVGLPQITGAAAVFGVAFVSFNSWHGALANVDPPTYAAAKSLVDTTVNLALPAFFTLALPIAPAVALVARPWHWSRPAQLTSMGTALVGLMALHDLTPQGFLLGNYLDRHGAYTAVLIDPNNRVVFTSHLWWLVIALAFASGVLLSGLLVEKARGAERLLVTFTVITIAGTAAQNLVGQGAFDRYLIALVPGALAIVLAPGKAGGRGPVPVVSRIPQWTNRAAALTATAVVGLLAFGLLANGFSFDAQRWRTATQLTREGIPATQIDAGLEWIGYHSPSGVVDRYPSRSLGFEELFYTNDRCYAITAGRRHDSGWELKSIVTYPTFLVAGKSKLYVYATHAGQCA
jgi:hypothetical protein